LNKKAILNVLLFERGGGDRKPLGFSVLLTSLNKKKYFLKVLLLKKGGQEDRKPLGFSIFLTSMNKRLFEGFAPCKEGGKQVNPYAFPTSSPPGRNTGFLKVLLLARRQGDR